MAVYSLDTRARSYGYDLFHGEVDVGLIRADVSAVDDQVYYTFVPHFDESALSRVYAIVHEASGRGILRDRLHQRV